MEDKRASTTETLKKKKLYLNEKMQNIIDEISKNY